MSTHKIIPWALFIGACILYCANLNRPPHPDELYHVLAARGFLEFGEPRIADGVYLRVFAHTWVVAQLFQLFGESLVVARLASLVPIALCVVVIYIWVHRVADKTAALISAVLFAVSPFAFEMAQYTRFYGFQALFFLSGAALFYRACYWSGYRFFNLILAAVFFGVACYLQLTTVMGMIAIAIWWSLFIAFPWVNGLSLRVKTKAVFLLLLMIVIAVMAIVFWRIGLLQLAWGYFRNVQVFNQETKDQFWYYYLRYFIFYPSLWPLIGIISLSAIAKFQRPAIFVIIVFAVSFILNSAAATKGLPYIMYAQAFYFIILGLGLAPFWHVVKDYLLSTKKLLVSNFNGRRGVSYIINGLIAFALIILIAGNPFVLRTVSLAAGFTVPPEKPDSHWEIASPYLTPELNRYDVVVTMAELEMLYYIGDYDVLLSASRLAEIPEKVDFGKDPRTGRSVVGTKDGLMQLLGCYETGLFITNSKRWGEENILSREQSEIILSRTSEISLPEDSRVIAFEWDNRAVNEDQACVDVPAFD